MSSEVQTPPPISTRSRRSQRAFFDSNPAQTHLKRAAVRGVAVTFGSQIAQFILGFGSTAILARLLTPESFGLVAMTSVFTGFIWLFSDAGLATATIQRETITHEQVSALLWVNVLLGSLLTVILFAAAPLVAAFYDEPRLVGVTRGIAVSFFLGGFTVQHKALMRRQLRFSTLSLLDIIAVACGITVAITMAILDFGYWSLVGMANATAIASVAGVWLLVPWRPGPPCWTRETWPMLKFGQDILSSNLFTYFSRQADTLLIGWKAGPTALGFYDKAYRMLLFPVRQINVPIGSVLVPALSRLNGDPPRFARFFLRAVELLTGVTIPLVLGVCVFANQVVAVWLGPQWAGAAHLFRLLTVAAVVGVMSNPISWLMIATGRARRLKWVSIVSSAVYVTAFLLGLPYGAEGVAIAYSTAVAGLFFPVWVWSVRDTPVTLPALLRSFLPPMVAALLAAAIGHTLLHTLVTIWPAGIAAATAILAYMLVYSVVLLIGFKRWTVYRSVIQDLRRSRGGSPVSVVPSESIPPAAPAGGS